jgi:cathepsin B
MNRALIIVLFLVSFTLQQEFLQKPLFEQYNFWENPFINWTHDEIKSLLSLKHFAPLRNNIEVGNVQDLPTNFDARVKWPECIHPIRDQQHCGSCWAFGLTEVLSDRFCIASQGKINKILSPEDLVQCDSTNHGCNGGNLEYAWIHTYLFGVVEDSCKPYRSGDGKTRKCEKSCEDKTQEYKKYHNTFPKNPKTIEAIKREIMENGPVETGFEVYSDFMTYKSGIYVQHSGKLEGGHAVKIVGWGVENGIEFWICANSWTTGWGENGFFRIKMDQCGISSQVIAGLPKL